MGIVGRDAAPGQQPVTAGPGQGPRYCPRLGSRLGSRRARGGARRDGAQPAGWPFVPARIAGSRSGT